MTVNSQDRWIRRFRPAPEAATRLVCFPHAGASASFYVPVCYALAPSVDVLAVQYPGRQDRRTEPCVESIAELAERVSEVLDPWFDRPVAFFGHSMGATVAFEVARILERDGIELSTLFVSGRRAPSRYRFEDVHTRSDDGLLEELVSLGGTDAELLTDAEMVRMILPPTRGDYKAIETYRYQPGPELSCPVVAMTGDADPKVDVEEVRAWREHTTSQFELEVFNGGHFYLMEHQEAVVRTISRWLGAQAGTGKTSPVT